MSRFAESRARAERIVTNMSTQDLVSIGLSKRGQAHFLDTLKNQDDSLIIRKQENLKIFRRYL